mmetsp:Transcript_8193/g.27221  ORF Transcript_8193/g.27221 Transcript_8193/m.27221 type:complete len:236 (-) Transcript_8193:2127-2834(-)
MDESRKVQDVSSVTRRLRSIIVNRAFMVRSRRVLRQTHARLTPRRRRGAGAAAWAPALPPRGSLSLRCDPRCLPGCARTRRSATRAPRGAPCSARPSPPRCATRTSCTTSSTPRSWLWTPRAEAAAAAAAPVEAVVPASKQAGRACRRAPWPGACTSSPAGVPRTPASDAGSRLRRARALRWTRPRQRAWRARFASPCLSRQRRTRCARETGTASFRRVCWGSLGRASHPWLAVF